MASGSSIATLPVSVLRGALNLDFQNVQAIYQAGFEMDVDNGDSGGGETFDQRNIYGGFKHATPGKLIAGRFDTLFNDAQRDVDYFLTSSL
jgi:predicted porin